MADMVADPHHREGSTWGELLMSGLTTVSMMHRETRLRLELVEPNNTSPAGQVEYHSPSIRVQLTSLLWQNLLHEVAHYLRHLTGSRGLQSTYDADYVPSQTEEDVCNSIAIHSPYVIRVAVELLADCYFHHRRAEFEPRYLAALLQARGDLKPAYLLVESAIKAIDTAADSRIGAPNA
jgi:hypothetical protein